MSDLVWLCDQCKEPIPPGDGLIEVSYLAIRAARNGGELAPWRKWHDLCDPERDGSQYWFAIERVATFKDALRWAFHFNEKSWLQHTNWIDVLEEATRGRL